MNYTVHAVMYFYYFMASVPSLKKYAFPFAQSITTIQIVQMIVGSTVTVAAAVWHHKGGRTACFIDPANSKMGLAMYLSYLVLFTILFSQKYLSKGSKKGVKATKICGVEDKAGFFHTNDHTKSASSANIANEAAKKTK